MALLGSQSISLELASAQHRVIADPIYLRSDLSEFQKIYTPPPLSQFEIEGGPSYMAVMGCWIQENDGSFEQNRA